MNVDRLTCEIILLLYVPEQFLDRFSASIGLNLCIPHGNHWKDEDET